MALVIVGVLVTLPGHGEKIGASSGVSPRINLQFSGLKWGDVQIGQIIWHQPSTSNEAWAGELKDLVYSEKSLGSVRLVCHELEASNHRSCAQGEWLWQLTEERVYEGQFSWLPNRRPAVLIAATGLEIQLTQLNGELDWKLDLNLPNLGLLRTHWPSTELPPAQLSGQMSLHAHGNAAAAALALTFENFSFDSSDGMVAASELNGSLDLDISHVGDIWQVQSQAELGPGLVLIHDLFLDLADRVAGIELNASWMSGQQQLVVEHLAWSDAPILELEGHGTWADGAVREIRVERFATEIERLLPTYLSGWQARAALNDLQATGRIWGALGWRDQQLQTLRLDLADIDIVDGRGRFALHQVAGAARLHGETASPPSSTGSPHNLSPSYLTWESVEMLGISIGASELSGQWLHDAFQLTQQLRLPILDGALRVDELRVAKSADSGWDVDLNAELEPISMERLTTALGWPGFGGAVGGRLPGAEYQKGVLRLDGALDFSIFDGRVRMDQLALERPFGPLPSLSGDLELEFLDLEQLTQAFSFGRITGPLSGYVRDMRLLDWRPVAFDARLATPPGGKGRISQRAVDNLSRIGGGGGAVMSGIVGRLFDEFPYRRLGLACRLQNNVCVMDGVAPSAEDNAYLIVEGRSLPRITVKGYQRQVDWLRVVSQLQQIIATGAAPTVD